MTGPHKPRRALVIVGAGASKRLGRDRDMPLMPDWSDSLIGELREVHPGLPGAMGLTAGMAGDEFERALGRFLAFQQALPLMVDLGAMTHPEASGMPRDYRQSIRVAETNASAALNVIHRNLFDKFGILRLDSSKAKEAYRHLHGLLGAHRRTVFVAYATTNYDLAIEAGIGGVEPVVRVLDGFRTSPFTTPELDPLGLADEARQANDRVPVLHLHGAVGWCREKGRVLRHPADRAYNDTLGEPALLLPDDTKTADSLVGGEGLWAEFRRLLADATHVMFLGHSLHDQHLVDAVAGAAKPTAVAWYMPEDIRSDPDLSA